jgi:hypothetical protein
LSEFALDNYSHTLKKGGFGLMFYEEEMLLAIFRAKYKDRNVPDEVIKRLTEYTSKNHSTIRSVDIDSLLFLGTFESMKEVEDTIVESKSGPNYIYDHYATEFNGLYYLFEYWFNPME